MDKSRLLALTAIFASLTVVCDSIAGIPQISSGVWYSWIFMIEPLNGMMLPPYAGFFSTLIGVVAGHVIYPRDPYEFLYTMGAPVGALISGLLFRKKHKIVLAYFIALFAAYFATPISWQLPLWGMWDTYCAFAALIIADLIILRRDIGEYKGKALIYSLMFYAFIGLEADILFRIFLFIPCRTYSLFFGFTEKELQIIWVAGAIYTPLQVGLSALFTSVVGAPLFKALKRMNLLF